MTLNNKNSRFTPIIIAISIVVGIVIGTFYTKHFSGNKLGIINGSSNKITALMRIIDDQYVDTVNMHDLVENAIPLILSELDPHSKYIPAKDLEATNSELEGSFGGIGIQFSIQKDTIHVNNVIKGGPSEKVGIMPGDRIVAINDTSFIGKIVTDDESMRRLKGKKGTDVKIKVKRLGKKDLLSFTIERGEIPQTSVDASYMITPQLGYIYVSKFGRTTHVELLNALAMLSHKGCKGLILDLRGNTGGYMDAAVQMVNEFLKKGSLIVYTQGHKFPRTEEYADGTGSFQNLPLEVLVDEGSASASEIFSGAIQDNDRGLILGRRSFGKGLVQQPIEFSDGSAVRLTVARYYTPSGRCIQRPYVNGNDENYEMDLINRYQHGEFFSRDSIKLDKSKVYHTSLNRPVYGGGGIMPDVFIPEDTTNVTSYYSMIVNNALDIMFGFTYTDSNRATLNEYSNVEDLVDYLKTQNLIEKLANYAEKNGIKRRNLMIEKSHNILQKRLFGRIIYNMLGQEASMEYVNQDDKTVLTAITLLQEGKSYPKAPIKGNKTTWLQIPYRPLGNNLASVLVSWQELEANQYAAFINCGVSPVYQSIYPFHNV
jgi:carboxyl-terminal processing protease